jgi:hypothetical protein
MGTVMAKMPKLVTDELRSWTVGFAKQINQAMKRNPVQRNSRNSIMNSLGNKMIDGRYHGGEVATSILVSTGEEIGVNGCHQSTIIEELNESNKKEELEKILNGPKVRFKQFSAETMEDIILLYNQFDDNLNARKQSDKGRAYSLHFGKLEEWSYRAVNLIVGAVAAASFNKRLEYDKKVELTLSKEWKEHAFFVKRIVFDCESIPKHIARQPVAEVMLHTHLASKDHAEKFWTSVRDGANQDANDPCKILRDYLLTASLSDNGLNSKKRVTQEEIIQKCIDAWNYWLDGRKISNLKRKDRIPTINIPNRSCNYSVINS